VHDTLPGSSKNFHSCIYNTLENHPERVNKAGPFIAIQTGQVLSEELPW
jgi:hypothetical protein